MQAFFLNSQDLIVRPITFSEESEWNVLMAQHHYLGFKSILGEQIKYVAILDGQWVALLGWGAAALKCYDRDRYLGWNTFNTFGRLKYMAGNWRFLILPGIRIKNLASKILSLNLKRLSVDWVEKYGSLKEFVGKKVGISPKTKSILYCITDSVAQSLTPILAVLS